MGNIITRITYSPDYASSDHLLRYTALLTSKNMKKIIKWLDEWIASKDEHFFFAEFTNGKIFKKMKHFRKNV